MKLRSNKYIRIATFLIAVIMCILTIPANALDSVRMEKQYYADIAYTDMLDLFQGIILD